MTTPREHPVLYTLLGLNRTGRMAYTGLVLLAGPILAAWFVLLPRLRFSDEDERLLQTLGLKPLESHAN